MRAAMEAEEPFFDTKSRESPFSYVMARGLPASPEIEPDAEGKTPPSAPPSPAPPSPAPHLVTYTRTHILNDTHSHRA